MANANKRHELYEDRARQLNALADSIPVHSVIDGKVADLFREAATMMNRTSRTMKAHRRRLRTHTGNA